MQMNAEQRANAIAAHSPESRRKLAHLASIGAQKKAQEAALSAQIAIELTREPADD